MPPNTTDTPWQTRARHDASELRHLADTLALMQYANMTSDQFAEHYIELSKEIEQLGESMWQAAMAAWAGDLWPKD